MRIQDFHPVEKESLGLPEWWEQAMKPVYDYLGKVGDILQGQVGFDNLNWEVKDLAIETGIPLTFRSFLIAGKAIGAILIASDAFTATNFFAQVLSEDQITVSANFTPTPTKAVPCKVLVFGK